MPIWRTALAAVGIAAAPAYLVFAQPAAEPKAIGILLAAGDISYCGDDQPWKLYPNKVADLIRGVIKEAGEQTPKVPVKVLALGDLAYPDGTAEQLDCFKGRWGDFYDVLLPVPGNHEYRSPNPYGDPYFAHFKKHGPSVTNKDGKQVPLVSVEGEKTGYYAVNFPKADGPWRLVALNPYVGGQKKGKKESEKAAENKKRAVAMAAQTEWLTRNVSVKEGHAQNCVLAFMHPPTFSSGRHGHEDYSNTAKDKNLTKRREMRKAFEILYDHGATAILAGHEHNYEQFLPQNPKGVRKDDGIRLFVVGTGGTNLTEDFYDQREENSEVLYGKEHGNQGVLKIELFEKSYRWSFLQIDKAGVAKKAFHLPTTKGDCIPRKTPSG
jgi:hypothetical protein